MQRKGIKDIREKLLLSQSEFAELIGVSRQTVSNWEKGNWKITEKHWKKIEGITIKVKREK